MVLELVAAVKFKSWLPDANLQLLLQFLAVDAGSRIYFGGEGDTSQYELPHGVRWLRCVDYSCWRGNASLPHGVAQFDGEGDIWRSQYELHSGRLRWFRYMALIGGDEDISQRELSHGVIWLR